VVSVSRRRHCYCGVNPALPMQPASSGARVVAAVVMVTTVALLALGD